MTIPTINLSWRVLAPLQNILSTYDWFGGYDTTFVDDAVQDAMEQAILHGFITS
jgi:hypothetical protein